VRLWLRDSVLSRREPSLGDRDPIVSRDPGRARPGLGSRFDGRWAKFAALTVADSAGRKDLVGSRVLAHRHALAAWGADRRDPQNEPFLPPRFQCGD